VKTILIFDDEPPTSALLRRVTLNGIGYTVLEAATPTEAIRRCKNADADPNLLIVDVKLGGGVGGVRLAWELRTLLPSLRVILTSEMPPRLWDDQDAAEWSELPSDSVITLIKPVHAQELLHSIYKLIGAPVVSTSLTSNELS
jgi:CheY-like chemotaxis protein